MNVIFLDIDGVLNTHDFDQAACCGPIHRKKVQTLNKVIRATDAKIVLSSAWRYIIHRGEAKLEGLDWLLRSHGLIANTLIGYTREDTMRENPNWDGDVASWPLDDERGQQITDWLAGKVVNRYAVIDDMDLGISQAGHPFLHLDGTKGLLEEHTGRLINMLMEAKP